jgi:benzylsuccinate CoA-transferase BbsF subunit/naphthyl-2-methylsuccinate CoA transferase subunit
MNERDSTEDRHLHERKFFTSTEHPEAGTHKHVMTPFKSRNHQDVGPRRAAPLLGEDNEYVYKEVLGYSEEQYKKFEEQGHIGMDFDPSIQ